MRDVVSDVEDPEADDEDGDGGRAVVRGVAEEPADVGGVSDDENSGDDGDGADEDEGPAAAVAAGAAVAHVADEGLHEEAGDWAAEPDDAGPLVGDPQLLNVGRQQREL